VINESGMPVASSDWKRLQQDVQKQLSDVGVICLSGSLPPGSTAEDLQGVLSMLVDSGKQVWVDTSGMALSTALSYSGICIKVNGHELGEALGLEINDIPSAKRALIMLQERGPATAAITLGSGGALLATKEGAWQARGLQVKSVSTVGSGDAFLGGLVTTLDRGKDWPEALGDAVAAGTANTLTPGGGQFALQDFYAIRKQIHIQPW
jgi:fructose-1-phosphate kinase PfkB-like protein